MQDYSFNKGRNAAKQSMPMGGIDSKVKASPGPMGKSMGNMPESPVSTGGAKKSVTGFSGGVINPMVGR